MHKHRNVRTKGPFGCSDNVAYLEWCSCGAERRTCHCNQCARQGTNDTGWYMPVCTQCKLRHPKDASCAK